MLRPFERGLPLGCALRALVIVGIVLPVVSGRAMDVWTPDPLDAIQSDWKPGPDDGRDFVTAAAPRGGVASVQVVARDTEPVSASATDLAGPNRSALPASTVTIRYAALKTPLQAEPAPYFDALLDEPPSASGLQPVWATIQVPADAAPGSYRGKLVLQGTRSREVEIRLTVGRWRVPARGRWLTWATFHQYPEVLARTYGVPLWSEEHLGLVEQSLRMIGQVANKQLTIPVLRETRFNNEHGMLVFRLRGDRPVPDFRFVDKYLDLYARHVGEPVVLCLYVWGPKYNDHKQGRAKELRVTFLEDDGELVPGTLPMFGDDPQSEPLWREVMEGMRTRVERRGWDPGCITLGYAHDRRPAEKTLALFERVAPYARWVMFTHGRGDPPPVDGRHNLAGMTVAYEEQPSGMPKRPPKDGLLSGWQQWQWPYRRATSARAYVLEYSNLNQYRTLAEGTVTDRYIGFCEIGLDGWGVHGREEGWINLFRDNPTAIVAPGPQGPVATVRFEMLREGIQECEARIALERALVFYRVELGEELAGRCEELLRARDTIRWKRPPRPPESASREVQREWDRRWGRYWNVDPGWQERTAELFDLAGEVCDKVPVSWPPRPATAE